MGDYWRGKDNSFEIGGVSLTYIFILELGRTWQVYFQ